jgi:hypothetical protein
VPIAGQQPVQLFQVLAAAGEVGHVGGKLCGDGSNGRLGHQRRGRRPGWRRQRRVADQDRPFQPLRWHRSQSLAGAVRRLLRRTVASTACGAASSSRTRLASTRVSDS